MSMQVSVENVQGLERRLKVCVPVETVDKVVEDCFQKVSKTVKIDGFRPGKVPRKMLEDRYGESIRIHEAAPQIIQDTLWDAFKQANVEPVGRPILEGSVKLVAKEPLNYSVLFDVLPEIILKDLTGKEVEQVVSEVTDADLDKAIEQLRQEHATWESITTPAQVNDVVELSHTVEVDGETVELEKAENLSIQLGKHANKLIIPDLEDKLVGVSTADEKVIEATFPEDYPAASVAGKKAKFAVKVHGVKRSALPELNEEFIKKFDGAASLEEFRTNIRNSMVYYLKTALENINKIYLFDALTEVNPIDIPKSMVRAEIEHMAKGFLQSIFGQQKISEAEIEKHLPFLSKFYKKPAQSRVRLSLVIEAFIKAHPQTITDEMISKTVEERSALYQDPKAWIEEYMSVPANKDQIRAILLELAIADKLRENASTKKVELDYFGVLEKEKSLQNRGFDQQDLDEDEEGHVHDEHCGHAHHQHDHAHDEHCQHEGEEEHHDAK